MEALVLDSASLGRQHGPKAMPNGKGASQCDAPTHGCRGHYRGPRRDRREDLIGAECKYGLPLTRRVTSSTDASLARNEFLISPPFFPLQKRFPPGIRCSLLHPLDAQI